MSAHNLDLHAINNPIVRSAIEALNNRNKKQWYELFSDMPQLGDDGNPYDFTEWSEKGAFWFLGILFGIN
ncbi:MAG TPA: hypothetical protein VI278_12895 [Nitrososphaeraceae archaeon]